MMKDSISLVFPMYNEIKYFPRAIETAKSALEEITSDYEIIIVDDASTDGSGQLAKQLSKTDNKIKVIHHIKNRKLGGALKTGFSNAAKEIIIYSDIDLPFDFSILKYAIPLTLEYDIVIGCRIGAKESLLRTIYSKVYNFLINFIFTLGVKDVNFAMKIFKKEVLKNIDLKAEGSFINAEFLAKAKRFGYTIKEIEVEYMPRTYGVSRLSSPGVIFKILFEMLMFYPEIALFSKKKAMYSRLKKLYRKTGLKAKIYNFIRFKTCPYDEIKGFIPRDGAIVDLGCGTGLFLNLLRENNNRMLFGFDKDRRKIKVARKSINKAKDIKFEEIDICNANLNLPKAKCITLMDVMYYLDLNTKKILLKKCYNVLDSDGLLIIKDIEKNLSLKFLWTYLQEFLAVKVFRLTFAEGLFFEKKVEYLSFLKENGFVTEAFDLSRGYLYPHILYVGKKQ